MEDIFFHWVYITQIDGIWSCMYNQWKWKWNTAFFPPYLVNFSLSLFQVKLCESCRGSGFQITPVFPKEQIVGTGSSEPWVFQWSSPSAMGTHWQWVYKTFKQSFKKKTCAVVRKQMQFPSSDAIVCFDMGKMSSPFLSLLCSLQLAIVAFDYVCSQKEL